MQLELFLAEETVRGYEQRIAAHAEHARTTRLLAIDRHENLARQPAAGRAGLASRIEASTRRHYRLWCRATPRRWVPCSAHS